MLEQLQEIFILDKSTAWVTQVFIVVFLTLLAGHIVSRIIKRLHTKFQNTKNLWDDSLIISIKQPLRTLVWIIGFTFAVEVIYKQSGTHIFSAIYPFRDVAVIASITWFIMRLIKELQINITNKKKQEDEGADPTTIDAMSKILRATVIITAGLIILQTLGFSISGVLAFGGVGGVAIGFAAKDLLANFFGALMIYFDRPFKVGDWIRSPDKKIEGTVEEIGWRQTRIRTFDKRPLYVPNSVFSTISVENPSRMTNRRIYETIGVRYDDIKRLDKIIKDVKNMLKIHKDIDNNQTMIVNVNAFAPSSVDFFVYTFTHTTDWIEFHAIKQEIMLKIADIIENNGAEIAFPTSTIHLHDAIQMKEAS